jgi:DNA-binding response OmpR family regulator
MTRSHRFRITFGWLALIAMFTVAGTFVRDPQSPDDVARQFVLCCGTAIVLLWSVADAVLFCGEAAEKKKLHSRTTGADSTRAARLARRKSRFLALEAIKLSEVRDAAAHAEASLLPPFAGKTVLIADDDFDITQTLVIRFERLGMTALRTSDALQLLFGVHKVKADLIVLDVTMPSGNGLALCELLNSDESLARLPVIVYTSCSSEVTVRRCRALGAHYVLKAPDSWSAIEKIVYHLFCVGEQATARPNWEPHETTREAEPVPIISSPDHISVMQPPIALPSPALPQQVVVVDDPSRIFRVLAIHLDPDLLVTLAECSRLLHMSVSNEPNPEQGYWACLSQRPDVIILGAQTRISAVTDVLSRLKANPLCKRIPLLEVVGPGGEICRENAERPLADQFLRSPVGIDEAMCALRLLLERANPSAATISTADSLKPFGTAFGNDGSMGDVAASTSTADNQWRSRECPLVLVIDDDPDISAAIALRLSTYRVDVLPAFAGIRGYWKAIDIRPDVILCDMRLPDGEGNYIVGRLQSHPLTQDIPVIVITGQDKPGLKCVMLSMGVAAYLSKPIVMKELINELRQHIVLLDGPRAPWVEQIQVEVS